MDYVCNFHSNILVRYFLRLQFLLSSKTADVRVAMSLTSTSSRGSAYKVDGVWTHWTPYTESLFVYRRRNRLGSSDQSKASVSEISTPAVNASPEISVDQCDG